MMFSLGCIQALKCNTNHCPTGVATQDKELMKGLDPTEKAAVRLGNRPSLATLLLGLPLRSLLP